MKKTKLLYKILIVMFMFVVFTMNHTIYAQTTVSSEFDIRGPLPTNPTPSYKNGIYNLRGDFHMIGNTNMVKPIYENTGTNNSTQMRFVDVDDDPATYNSSSAYLNLPDDECTKIVYAGLYWSGRAQQSTSSGTNIASQSFTNYSTSNDSDTRTISSTAYNAAATITNITGNSTTNRTFNIILGGGKYVTIRFNGNNAPSYSIDNSATFTTLPGTFSNDVFTISTTNNPLDFTINGKNYKINSVTRSGRNSVTSTTNRISVTAPVPVSQPVNYAFNKRTIKFKKEGGAYVDLTADATQIHFPTTSTNSDYIYVAYKDVTNLVTSGGNYFGADIALRQGSSTIGYGGGWGMVVIYENPTKPWRDIVVFDGFSNVPYDNSQPRRLTVDGFRAAQRGAINVDLGFMSYEGESGRSQDYFKMKRGGTSNIASDLDAVNSNTNYPYLTLAGDRINTNYFNSEITNTYPEIINFNSNNVTNRLPYFKNNYGVDIAKISLSNTNYEFITNSQTATDLYFGNRTTSGDAFVLYNVVFGVDAYVPEATPISMASKIIKASDPNNPIIGRQAITEYMDELQPDDILEMEMRIINPGNERVKDALISLNIPEELILIDTPTMTIDTTTSKLIDSVTAIANINTFSQPVWNANSSNSTIYEGGVITWDLGTFIPKQEPNADPFAINAMATMKYTLRVTDNCDLLKYSNATCLVSPKLSGGIEGLGELSNAPMGAKGFITGVINEACREYQIGTLDFKVPVTEAFLIACNAGDIVKDIELEYPCGDLKFDSQTSVFSISKDEFLYKTNAELMADGDSSTNVGDIVWRYPSGTKFYTKPPSSDTPVAIDLNNISTISVTVGLDTSTNSLKGQLYAVIPDHHMNGSGPFSCYYKVSINVTTTVKEPVVPEPEISSCAGKSYNYEVLVAEGTIGNVALKYYYKVGVNKWEPMPNSAIKPNPTSIGNYEYGVTQTIINNGGIACESDVVPFNIEIIGCSMKVNPQIYNKFKRP